MAGTNPVGHENLVRGKRDGDVRAQRDYVGVRVGIAVSPVAFRPPGSRDRPVIARMVGVIVIASRMLVPVALANLVRVLDLYGQIRASHITNRDSNDEQTLEDGSHVNSPGSGECDHTQSPKLEPS